MATSKSPIISKAKVTKSLAKNPTQTQRQVAKDTGLSLGNVNDKLKDIEQNGTKSDIMDRILAMDDEIMELVNGMHLKTIKEKIKNKEKLTLGEHKLLGDLANNSTKRKAIFGSKEDGTKDRDIVIQI